MRVEVEASCANLGLPPAPAPAHGHLFTGPQEFWTLYLWTASERASTLAVWAEHFGDVHEVVVTRDGRVARVVFRSLETPWSHFLAYASLRFVVGPDGTSLRLSARGIRADLHELLARLEDLDETAQLRAVHGTSVSHDAPGVTASLTTRQIEAVRAALEKGYYDDPREVTLHQLAADLGISAGSLSQLLRRAHRELVRTHLDTTPSGSEAPHPRVPRNPLP